MNKQIKRIAISALLVALGVVFSRFLSIPIPISGNISMNLGFGILPILILCALYGPVYGCVGAMCWDLIGALLFPFGPFVIWFTLAAGVYGAVTGAFFAKARLEHIVDDTLGDASIYTIYHCAKPITVKRIAISTGVGQLIYSVFLNSLLISLLYGKPFFRMFLVLRLLENAVMVVLNTALANVLLGVIKKAKLIPERFNSSVEETALQPLESEEFVIEPVNYSELLGQVGGYICNNDYEKASEVYETLMLAYRRDSDIFTDNQKREFAEYKRDIVRHNPEAIFVVEPAFDVENELVVLKQLIQTGNIQKARVQLDRINNYYQTNESMFSVNQKAMFVELQERM